MEIIIPEDYPEGERFERIRKKFEGGVSRTIILDGVKAEIFNWRLMALFAEPGSWLKYVSGEPVPKFDLFQAYVNGYSEGKAKFNELYGVTPAILFSDPEPYVQTLHEACFHCDPITGKEGFAWVTMISKFPYLFTNLKAINKFGFYAGLYASVMEMKRIYPRPFASFEECHIKKNGSSHEGLSNFEKAVRLQYLFKAGVQTEYPTRAGFIERNELQVYKEGWLKLTGKNKREPQLHELKSVLESLTEYPDIQKAVTNDIDKL